MRDYANYLGLDSAGLLATYEQDWNPVKEPEVVTVKRGSPWKAVGYVLLVVVALAVLGVSVLCRAYRLLIQAEIA